MLNKPRIKLDGNAIDYVLKDTELGTWAGYISPASVSVYTWGSGLITWGDTPQRDVRPNSSGNFSNPTDDKPRLKIE